MKKAWGGIHSIQFNLSLISILFSIPIVIFLVCTNVYSIRISREKEASLLKNSLIVFQSQVDSDFLNYERYLMTIMGESKDLAQFSRPEKDNIRTLAQFRIQNQLSELLSYNNRLFGLFVYSRASQTVAAAYDPDITMDEREALAAAILELGGNEDSGVLWFPWKAGGQWYLIRVLVDRGIMAGAVVKPEKLLADYKKNGQSFVDQAAYMSDTDGVLTETKVDMNGISMDRALAGYENYQDNGNRYMVTAALSEYGDFYLTAMVHYPTALSTMGYFQILLAAMTVICVVVINVQRWFFKRKIIAPMNLAVKAMEEVSGGNLSAHIGTVAAFNEFQVIYRTFDTMVDEIRQLKIDVYEENLRRKQTTLEYLALQMNPHFFVNAVNVVSRLIEGAHIRQAMKAMDNLGEYMRYALSCTSSVVSLESELAHAQKYVELQNVRYCSEAVLETSVNPYALFMAVPRMLIFTFVENAFKYARKDGERLSIFLKCWLEPVKEQEYLMLEIWDLGPGYPPEMLEAFGEDEPMKDMLGTHIGLFNVSSRLRLLYEGKAHIRLENKEGHAWAKICLPAIDIEQWEEKSYVSSAGC